MIEPDDKPLEDASAWLARMRGNGLNATDQAELKAWLALDPQNAAALDMVMAVWNQAGPLAHTAIAKSEMQRLERRPKQRARVTWGVGTWGVSLGGLVAASVVLAAVFVGQPHEQTYRTAIGQVASVTLADHSTVWLDTDTELKVKLSSGRRQVTLDHGMAEFQVVHDAARPFSVSVPGAEIRDVGTDFSVRLQGGETRLVLVSGAVQVKQQGNVVSDDLRPGQALRIPQAGAVSMSDTDPDADLAWRQGRLVFYRRPLSEVVDEFARYERLNVRFADAGAARLPVSGTYKAKDFHSFLTAMSALYGLKFTTSDTAEIVIRSAG